MSEASGRVPANENYAGRGLTPVTLTPVAGDDAGLLLASALARVLVARSYTELGLVANDD